MGAGKTTVGKQLAETLHMEFFDSDHAIEEQTGATIPWIFDIEGEAGFRERERRMIDELTARRDIVLATGGGAILDEENRSHLQSRGFVIYLHCSIDKQLQRTRRDRNRPLLQTENPRAKLEELFTIRDPLYRQVADLVVDTHQRNTRSVVKYILPKLANPLSEQAQ